MIRVDDVARIIEEHYSPEYALTGDPVGLQVGSPRQPVRAVLVALDPSPEAIRRARALRANLLVTHHPLLYEPLRTVDTSSLTGTAVRDALSAGISVYAAHTNLDAAPDGLSRELARRVGLSSVERFPAHSVERMLKLAVFVPEASAGAVHRALAGAGAGRIGEYDMCAFASKGEGWFRPLASARPAVGSRGGLEKVREVRLETLIERRRADTAIAAMKRAHPYEEVAYDLYPLCGARDGGMGCVGQVRPATTAALARRLAGEFKTGVRVSGSPPRRIRHLAVVPGSGGSLLGEARSRGAELLVTGEVRYHQMLEAEHWGMGVIELGHDRSEMPAVDLLARAVRRGLAGGRRKIQVATYRRSRTARFSMPAGRAVSSGGEEWKK